MATHDYVIANGTGAAVRSDLNNALAAIVSNNSGSSAPSTTYAYQWWADTNNNVLKIRNSANNAWITLRELDGTLLMEDGSASTPGLAFADDVNTGIFSPAADQIGFATGGAERLEIGSSEVVFNDPSNDVDFRVESNGQTHMLFVDAGNDRIGIGTSSPDTELDVAGDVVVGRDNTSGYSHLYFLSEAENSSARFGRISKNYDSPFDLKLIASTSSPDAPIIFNTALTSEACRIDTSGNFGIGTSSPDRRLEVSGSASGELNAARFTNTRDDGTDVVSISFGLARTGGLIHEAAKIKVIKDQAFTSTPSTVDAAMTFEVIKDENRFESVRLRSNGEVALTLAGGDLTVIGGGSDHSIFRSGKCGIHLTTDALLPTNGSGTVNDNTMDLGAAALRFDDIFATNGTIQTSDQTLKQDVAALTTAEIAVAKRIRGLVKTYRWIDAVEAKGDNARIHCGVIAQEVEQAFTDEGLDASRYALFTSNTWYEANGVPLTKDGPVTADDEGAVEVTRRGVRYPELLAFVMAGVNAEMTDVTSRLAALEAA